MQASGILFALVLFCLSLLPFSLSLSALLSLQPASMQTGGQAMPLCSACCERWVTEPDNTTNCSIFEEIKHSVCLKFHYLFAFFPPPQINLALYAKQWSSSRVESNKIRLPESCKALALLYPCTLWNKINVCSDFCTFLHFNNRFIAEYIFHRFCIRRQAGPLWWINWFSTPSFKLSVLHLHRKYSASICKHFVKQIILS